MAFFTSKNLLRLLLQFLLVVILLELLLRVVFYQQVGPSHSALLQTVKNITRKPSGPQQDDFYKNYLLARPDSPNEVNKQIALESVKSNGYEYSPWTEYKNIDFAGKYISTSGLIRTTTPSAFFNPAAKDTVTIFFFGGSTMFGVNATDRETIPAAFVRQYAEKFPDGVSIQVKNYGIPAYYSYNELMLFSHLLYSGKKPGVAIFLDGLNDFLMLSAAKERRPYFYYRLRLASDDKINFRKMSAINDSTAKLFEIPAGYTEQQICDSLLQQYFSNSEHILKLAKVNGVETWTFIQPNPFYHYPNQAKDPICDQQQSGIIQKVYPLLEKFTDSTGHWQFLGNMLVNETGYPFIDRFHYSPRMSSKIAARMVEQVGASINQ